jgi:hypothetical protein
MQTFNKQEVHRLFASPYTLFLVPSFYFDRRTCFGNDPHAYFENIHAALLNSDGN